MIYESGPWRIKLWEIEIDLKERNIAEKFKTDGNGTYSIIEQDIFLSAFAIRKLIDCKSKVKDTLRDFEFNAITYIPIRNIDFLHRRPQDDCYDFNHFERVSLNESIVCNFLIHSYIFFDGAGRRWTYYRIFNKFR